MSAPGHHCDVVLLGDVLGWLHGPGGHLTGVVVSLDVGEPTSIPVLLDSGVHGLSKGDRVAIRGTLASEKVPGEKARLVYVKPRPGGFEVIKKRRISHGS
jgi:hypothetical protein